MAANVYILRIYPPSKTEFCRMYRIDRTPATPSSSCQYFCRVIYTVKPRPIRIRPSSGSLSAYTHTIKGTTYPLISDEQDPQNPDHWNWQFTFKQPATNGKLRSRSFSVPRSQVDGVRRMIKESRALAKPLVAGLTGILAFLDKFLDSG
jgi:hypothetical protein